MDPSGQYHRRPQTSCLPTNFQYTASPALPSHGTHPMSSFDGLPRAISDQQFMNSWATNIFSSNYSMPTSMPVSQAPAQWTGPSNLLAEFDDQNSNGYYDYSPTPSRHESDGNIHRSQNYAEIPRTWPSQYDHRTTYDDSMVPKTYQASTYMIDPNKDNPRSASRLVSDIDYDDAQESSHDFARLSISRSPKIEQDAVDPTVMCFDTPPNFLMPSRESSNDSVNSSREMTVADNEDHGAEEPYAKLIYRALMSAPKHSMVLQEIYQWFRNNTAKGSSDTKGWMNSIRHNLSMNAAFKKTERKLSGDETKKSTEWVLEDFAVKDGVQSTTRYRKRTGNLRFTKSENPAPSRQSSGRRGGISASKTKSSRQRVRDDRSEAIGLMQRLDTGRQPYQQQSRSRVPRDFSPMTPCPEDLSSATPFFSPKSESFEVPYEDMCLEDVQGVYVDDGPLFSNGPNSPISPFHNLHSTSASQLY
ncbi:Forkhead box J3 [Hyphodiscus hymeniophilus]|uniref:Forkhead box J3 n=1 Tax=Hyphodiscus hymeniophilus TaxID=353542 RepID=A0A9P6VR98_9HELO|nr:Forkhead box J3 [Hyphodiscus hymeniophilus]